MGLGGPSGPAGGLRPLLGASPLPLPPLPHPHPPSTPFPLHIAVFVFLKLQGFFSLIFEFWKFQNCIWNQNTHFWGSLFSITFDLIVPYSWFCVFETLGGLFLVWFLSFENFEIVFWIRIPTFGRSVFYNYLIWLLLIPVFVFLKF